jgi:hypothetical protein
MKPGKAKYWRKLSAADYAALFPAKPKALRTMAYGLRRLGATGDGQQLAADNRAGIGNQVFTMTQPELAKALGVSVRTLQRRLPLFESYGILEVKRWRYRKNGGSPSSYRVFLGNVIPENFTYGGGDYPISARERRKKDS